VLVDLMSTRAVFVAASAGVFVAAAAGAILLPRRRQDDELSPASGQ
jgi:hypothetical protein